MADATSKTTTSIDERTKIPLLMLFTLGAFIASITYYIAKVEAKADAALASAALNKVDNTYLRSIDQRLSRIEGRLGIADNKGDNHD